MRNDILILLCLFSLVAACQKKTLQKPVLVTAHRGASGLAPENTMVAIVKAMELGADFSELDVQETADGEIILLHDDDLNRTSNRKGNIWDMNFVDLQGADGREPEDGVVGALGVDGHPRHADVVLELALARVPKEEAVQVGLSTGEPASVVSGAELPDLDHAGWSDVSPSPKNNAFMAGVGSPASSSRSTTR